MTSLNRITRSARTNSAEGTQVLEPEQPRSTTGTTRSSAGAARSSSAALRAKAAPRRAAHSSRRTGPKTDQRRLAELKEKLGDEDYMNGAILRIATVLSAKLTLR